MNLVISSGVDPLGAAGSSDTLQTTQVFRAKGSPASSGSGTPTHSARLRVSGSATDLITDGRASPTSENEWQTEAEKMSSVLPTMWMGTQSGRFVLLHLIQFFNFVSMFLVWTSSVGILVKNICKSDIFQNKILFENKCGCLSLKNIISISDPSIFNSYNNYYVLKLLYNLYNQQFILCIWAVAFEKKKAYIRLW